MTQRQRLLSVLQGKKPDKVPWYADLSYYYFSLEKSGRLESKYFGDEGYLRFHTDKGAGIYFYAPNMWDISYSGGVTYEEHQSGNELTTIYKTPYGELTSTQKYLPTTYSWGYTSHFVSDLEQLKLMLYVLQNTVYHANYEGFNKIDKLWGEHGLATAIPPISVSPLQKLLARWAGVENTVMLFADHMDEFESLLTQMQSTEDEPFRIICDSNAQFVEFAENLSSEITGKFFFEKFNAPYYTDRVAELHTANKYVGIHIDGTLTPCLSQLASCGFDVAEAVTPAPVGDIEIEDLRAAAGDITIFGGLPGGFFTDKFTDEYFDTYITNLLSAFKSDNKFVLGVADQVPPDAIDHRIKRVSELIDQT